MAGGNNKDEGNFVSGFRPYPQQGFQIQPQQNYWQGGNFMMPGINPGAPTMTSNIMERFPNLSNILSMASPPPTNQIGGSPYVGAPPQRPLTPTKGRNRFDRGDSNNSRFPNGYGPMNLWRAMLPKNREEFGDFISGF